MTVMHAERTTAQVYTVVFSTAHSVSCLAHTRNSVALEHTCCGAFRWQ